jgi:CheY-like chemotaxis protein
LASGFGQNAAMAPALEILVVEDDPEHALLLKDLLRDWGFRATWAEDGHVATLHLLGSAPLPALVILDMVMPAVSGWELLERMRAMPHVMRVPVLVVTASGEGEDLRPPVVGFLRKPYSVNELFAMVRKIVGP